MIHLWQNLKARDFIVRIKNKVSNLFTIAIICFTLGVATVYFGFMKKQKPLVVYRLIDTSVSVNERGELMIFDRQNNALYICNDSLTYVINTVARR